ncbi:uncharacterized protein K452DRAFT_320807 [Aplosporella prunicola CBS 121167]|uniref:Uncharacterized protein n=1 Tax=Aplosporella prunicola CBS 121167 TaxID=1176127 RepID=A0A6A6B5G4_9PEZI|nr:uncharacterized protein K452DRAFT_320807 [Aplosporella prunicola CBS 121167]KAF2138663.1 hypothetical protein K452DRAFT_320807 [Aplosporella prunicola CBS 121167]
MFPTSYTSQPLRARIVGVVVDPIAQQWITAGYNVVFEPTTNVAVLLPVGPNEVTNIWQYQSRQNVTFDVNLSPGASGPRRTVPTFHSYKQPASHSMTLDPSAPAFQPTSSRASPMSSAPHTPRNSTSVSPQNTTPRTPRNTIPRAPRNNSAPVTPQNRTFASTRNSAPVTPRNCTPLPQKEQNFDAPIEIIASPTSEAGAPSTDTKSTSVVNNVPSNETLENDTAPVVASKKSSISSVTGLDAFSSPPDEDSAALFSVIQESVTRQQRRSSIASSTSSHALPQQYTPKSDDQPELHRPDNVDENMPASPEEENGYYGYYFALGSSEHGEDVADASPEDKSFGIEAADEKEDDEEPLIPSVEPSPSNIIELPSDDSSVESSTPELGAEGPTITSAYSMTRTSLSDPSYAIPSGIAADKKVEEKAEELELEPAHAHSPKRGDKERDGLARVLSAIHLQMQFNRISKALEDNVQKTEELQHNHAAPRWQQQKEVPRTAKPAIPKPGNFDKSQVLRVGGTRKTRNRRQNTTKADKASKPPTLTTFTFSLSSEEDKPDDSRVVEELE